MAKSKKNKGIQSTTTKQKNKKAQGAGENLQNPKIEGVTEFNFIACDYQKIGNIAYLGEEVKLGKYGLTNEKKRKYENAILDDILIKSLEKVQQNIERKDIHQSLVIGCSEIRKQKMGKEKLSIFMKKEEKHTKYSRLNGVIGAVSVELSREDINAFEDGEKITLRTHLSELIRVNIRMVSRFDYGDKNEVEFGDEQQETTHFYKNLSENHPPFFTVTMLTYGVVDNFYSDVHFDDNNLFDFLLIDLFEKRLEEACVKGAYKTYRQFQGNDDKIKGSIDIARHIKLNMGQQNGRVAYKYRENIANNYLNILIVKAYQYIKKKYPELIERKVDSKNQIRQLITRLEYDVDKDVPLNTVIMKNLSPISHPFFCEYEDVRQICLRILRNEGASIFDSSDGDINGFLYYLPDLWEDYLDRIFISVLSESNLHDYKVDAQCEKGFISKRKEQDGFLCVSRPDYVFYHKGKPSLILDAKMRPTWLNVITESYFNQGDLGEDINKCIRDMEVFGTKGTGVVFPWEYNGSFPKQIDDYENAYSNEIIKYNRRISECSEKTFYVVPYRVPKCASFRNYNEWKTEFDKSKVVFKKKINEILTNAIST